MNELHPLTQAIIAGKRKEIPDGAVAGQGLKEMELTTWIANSTLIWPHPA
jgi:hypothetical protein